MLNGSTQNAAVLAGRVLLAAIFILAGFGKIGGYAGTVAFMESNGVPGSLLPLVILTELGGGLCILAGFQTRIVAFLLAGFCLVSGVLFHFQPAVMEQMTNFLKNIAIAGGFLVLMANGPGALSVDGWLKKA